MSTYVTYYLLRIFDTELAKYAVPDWQVLSGIFMLHFL